LLGHPERIPPIIEPLSDSTRGEQDTRVSKKIYIGNLPFSSTEADLQDLFGRHGAVESVAVITDRETGRPRGFAFVEMQNASDAADAIRALDGSDLGGRNIKVNEAQDKRGSGGGGGGGGYGGGGNRY
jgi:RNA recognition motif-containing protein